MAQLIVLLLVSCYCAWQQAEAERHKTFDTILELDQVGLVLTGRGCADLNMGVSGNVGPLGGSVNCTTVRIVSCYCAWHRPRLNRHKTVLVAPVQ